MTVPITIEATNVTTNVHFNVTLPTDELAAAYVRERGDRLCFHAEDAEADWQQWPLLMEALYPTCEHGLSAQLCYGPGHYPTYGVNTMDPTWQ